MISFQNNSGIGFKSDKFLVFYGNINGSIDSFKTEFLNLNLDFKRIKQTHSNTVVESGALVVESDAHYTAIANEALLISTADCMPIMIYCRQSHRIAAVHAGWRGVENKIIEKVLFRLIETGSSKKDFLFFIGPHILQNSFEVSADVYALLAKSGSNLETKNYVILKNDKYYIDLKKIVSSQIEKIIQTPPSVVSLDIDTKTDCAFYSYRRGKLKTERNLSFICLFQ